MMIVQKRIRLSPGILLTFLLVLSLSLQLDAQARKEVMRSTAISDDTPILNVTVTDEGFAWVGNRETLYQAYDMVLVTPLTVGEGEVSVAQLPDGNVDVRLQRDALARLTGGDEAWTCAYYDERRDLLYIGTEDDGVYLLATKPQLRVVEHLESGSSRLRSNRIKSMTKGRDGRLWIGTEKGVLVGSDGKWKLMESDLEIDGLSQNAEETWVAAYNELFFVDNKDDWYVYELPPGTTEGDIKDIAWDTRGNLWILSQVITEYSVEQEKATIYGPADYFTSEYATRIEAGSDGRVWVGTSDKGVYLLDKASLLSVDLKIDQPLGCDPNAKDAALLARISGGTPPYSLEWSNGLTGEHPTGLGPGTYSLTVTDDKGKARVAEVTVQDDPIRVTAEQTAAESAPGASDAQASVTVTGGQAPYQIEWDNGETGTAATRLTEGRRTIVVRDARGCQQTASIDVSATIAPLRVALQATSAPTCYGGNNGAISAEVTGGRAPYTYRWSGSELNGPTPESLKAGRYTLTVTDASGLTQTKEIELEQPPAIEVSVRQESAASANGQDGQAVAKASGGASPYTFAWDDGTTTSRAERLTPGVHTLTVTDASGCTVIEETIISEDILPLSADIELVTPLKCFGDNNGALRVEVTGGKAPYEFTWSDAKITGALAERLQMGIYLVTVSDVSGLTQRLEYDLSAPPQLEVTIRQESPATVNVADGQAVAVVAGGTPPYQYAWDDGTTSARADQLAEGRHTVTIADANGCEAVSESRITEDILPLDAQIQLTTPLACYGDTNGALTVLASGGKPPYYYVWSDESLKGGELTGLSPGSYAVTVVDASGQAKNLKYQLRSPGKLEVTARLEAPASANNSDGQAVADVTGGTLPLTFAWDDGSNSMRAEGLAAGDHAVTVVDANGCTARATVQVSETILPLNANLELVEAIRCAGEAKGVVKLKRTGGKAPFSIVWSTGEKDVEQVSNLAAGAYGATITDASSQQVEVALVIEQPTPLTITIENIKRARLDDTPDGRAEAIARGGTSPYSYLWDNDESQPVATELLMGNHSVTVTDQNGCSVTGSAEIKKRIIPELSAGMLSEGQTIRIQQLQFDADSTDINEGSKPVLFEVAEFLGENAEIVVEIGGHTNGIPEHEYCDWLSTERAKAVADFIVGQGVDGRRVYYKGYGKRKPVASNFTEEGRALNQRVEIKVLTIESE